MNGWEAIFAGMIVGLVLFFTFLIADVVRTNNHRNAAKQKIEQKCGGYARVFDSASSNTLIYSCPDGKLQTLDY